MGYFEDAAPDILLNRKVQVQRNGLILNQIEMSNFEEYKTCLHKQPMRWTVVLDSLRIKIHFERSEIIRTFTSNLNYKHK